MACSRTRAAVDGGSGDRIGTDRCYGRREGQGNEGNEVHGELLGCMSL